MSDPSPPPDAADIMTVVHEAVGGLELEPAEKREIWRFTRRELPYLWSQRTSYFILGSYRDPYIRQLRAVQNELTRQLGAYPFIMGDLIELPTDRLNTFDIMFSLLATYSDYIVGVFEKESGGEAPELGEIDDPPYFEKSYVYPRDYSWVTDAHLESKHHVIQAALEIAFTDDLTEDEAASKIKSLLERAQDTGINIAEDEVWEVLSNRTDTGEDPAAYSWVHLNKFRKFELHDRCFPWTTEEELRAAVAELPSPTPRPEWEERDES
ncbi:MULTISPECIES: hypothetical protein [Haloferax]|jgi:hypothetical protein|uniref:Uncharacterized protein n=3 Tax=Haloferax volcanii TaxID=2246 RepID=D4H0D8_HALVD|nr:MULTISPECIES: hypothetical protein [Haloferax]ADE05206.1 uncharacterized protein HVO_C0050 [Haloferax volcanii DS2]MBS8121347.1 hypothetical protein [Haloferax volcanii]MBS8126345.1 hypothetical protein [Haloferax volcanii]MBS8130215.1 hypothetical protein [Haloferax volcanii]MBS8134089.1 hypothetical protein [Haloferax volcanii]